MSKGKKRRILMLALAVLAAVLAWLWWQRPLSLAQQLPETTWKTIRVSRGLEQPETWEFHRGSKAWAELTAGLEQTRVTRRTGKPDGLDEDDFELWLYPETGSRTAVYVKESGTMAVAPEGDFDHYQYYDSGEELFSRLIRLLDGLPQR